MHGCACATTPRGYAKRPASALQKDIRRGNGDPMNPAPPVTTTRAPRRVSTFSIFGREGVVCGGRQDPAGDRAVVPQATVYKILRNRIYTGDFDWNGRT